MLQGSRSLVRPGTTARTIRLTLKSHNPIGPSIRRLRGSDCIVTSLPPNALPQVNTWPELGTAGIKVLIGAPLEARPRMQAECFFRDALLLLGPVEPMMGLVSATVSGHERRRPSAHRENVD
jgi:hypothetical protein